VSDDPHPPRRGGLWLVVALAAVGIAGVFIGHTLPSSDDQASSPTRPIVQINRQPGFPSVADVVSRLCPSIANIVTANQASSATAAPAFAVSGDGWLLASRPLPQNGQLEAVFGDGQQAPIDEVRTDPVSGLVIAHAQRSSIAPLTLADQLFAHVGDFGFSLVLGKGTGCAAQASMIGSDFLTDADAAGVHIRLQPGLPALAPGTPFLAGDGSVIGVATGAGDNSLLPAPIASTIVNELIRNSPSPIAAFGFRAIDFTADLAVRIGDARARGAGIALVQPKSAAESAGLRAGDIVLAVDQSPVSSASELSRALDAVDTSATLQIERNGERISVNVTRQVGG
jgi:S1-C subfamily serine protease